MKLHKSREPNYKNWVPMSLVWGPLAGSVGCLGLAAVCGSKKIIPNRKLGKTLADGCLLAGIGAAATAGWMSMLHREFSYDGKRQMARQIIDGIAEHVELPENGVGLDVGCGSGALTIACAKRNPEARMVGCDIWSGAYKAVFTKKLCEENAAAEGVTNASFREGNALNLPFADESFDAVTSNYVYHNILGQDRQEILLETLRVLKKGGTFAIHDIFSKAKYGEMQTFVKKLRSMGYEKVELINTTNGMFMSLSEAKWMALSGSALLVGKK